MLEDKFFRFFIGAAVTACVAFLGGCDRPHSEEMEARREVSQVQPPPVVTEVLPAVRQPVKFAGIATVLNPDGLLQLDADIRAATVAANFSRGQLERFRTSTMLSKQMVATAVRQEGLDASQLKLLQTRLRQSWGDQAPFLNEEARQALMTAIANGSRAILRIDFPDAPPEMPVNVTVAPLRGGPATRVEALWVAPSGNLAMPGVSYFALVEAGPGLRAGDRGRAAADSAEMPAGVVIPNSSLVVYAGKSWCYVETGQGKYERRVVPLDAPVDQGYLVQSGFAPGARVVVKGAAVLLAREAAPGSFDDDDDDGGAQDSARERLPASPSPLAQYRTDAASDPD